MSTKIDGIRWRHVPRSACVNNTTLSAARTSTSSRKPNTVARIRTQVASPSSSHTWVNSTSNAPAGTAKLRSMATGPAIALRRRASHLVCAHATYHRSAQPTTVCRCRRGGEPAVDDPGERRGMERDRRASAGS